MSKSLGATTKKVLGSLAFLGVVGTTGVAQADYPPVPSDLGKRVETPAPAPSRLAEAAAVAIKPESLAVIIEPKANVKTVTVRAVNTATGKVTTRVVVIPTGSDRVTPTLSLSAGSYRVRIIGVLKNGSEVRWSAGTQTISKKRTP